MRHRTCLAAVFVSVVATACAPNDGSRSAGRDTTSRVALAGTDRIGNARVVTDDRVFVGVGRTATASEIGAWDIDVNSAGVGLPAGRGTYTRGARVFAQQCAVCHGVKGEGVGPNPRLVGRDPTDFEFGRDPKIVKTVGNYWPYATTLYDYINRAMPFTAPGSLSHDDVYSVVAYLLAENGVIDSSEVMNARRLPRVRMPAFGRFVVDNRSGGPAFR